ncbi:hypothetical protein SAMN05444004_114113 [Jannaschia faecimaris]|uniref:Uncharacterized protein n=1 Tax=Jannaschia faecimaris TaxID=1244108 RepID=A0A1H3T3Y3_9RHOB|nr:hypothetical protein [Jannaschia faecimaris]SDZ44069.1 hypothetical protein SAMN05444004_114113 [Jannaschia faecimaris]
MSSFGDRGDGARGPYLGVDESVSLEIGGASFGMQITGSGSGNTAQGTLGVDLGDLGSVGVVTDYDANGFV